MFAKKNEQNEYDIVKGEQPFYTKGDALMEGTHMQESTLYDKLTELKVVEEWLSAHQMRCNFYSKHICISFTGPVCT